MIGLIVGLIGIVAIVLYAIFHKQSPTVPLPPQPPIPPTGILPNGVHLTVVNQATGVRADEVAAYIAAQQLQIDNDFQPYWGGSAKIDTQPGGWVIYLLDDSDVKNALGYHDIDGSGTPFARVFVRTSENDGVSWQSVASHEVLETLTDSNANTFVIGPDGCDWFREASDAVEDTVYTRNGIELSDFVTPAYFDSKAKGPFDFLAVLTAPFTITKGGYAAESCTGSYHVREKYQHRISVDRDYPRRKKS